jgi:glycosyltransferase involved in cell wall biosynthesis
MTDSATPLVSIVVPTFNRCSSLRRLLEALSHQTYPHSQFEVIVVDDGSTDGTVAFARDWEASVRLRVFEQAHAGPAVARNRGVTEAWGELILFLDDDVVPVPELIAVHVATHAAEPNAVVIGPMSPPGDWSRPAWVRWEEEKLLEQYRALVEGVWACSGRQFYTGNASLTRARFLEAGGFDSTFLRAEDVELGYRLEALDARFVFNPRADVLHYAWRTFASWCRSPYQYGRYDVVMQRDKGQPTLDNATREFHGRHALNRIMLYVCAGRRPLVDRLVPVLGVLVRLAGRIGARRITGSALSAIFSLLYWQGVCDELGDRGAMWRSITAAGHIG